MRKLAYYRNSAVDGDLEAYPVAKLWFFCFRRTLEHCSRGSTTKGARAKGRGAGGTSVLYEVDECSQMDETDCATDDEENAEHQVGDTKKTRLSDEQCNINVYLSTRTRTIYVF